MRYLLDESLALRGWERLPFAVIRRGGGVEFLDAQAFEALRLCDGTLDLDSPFIPAELRTCVERLAERGAVRPLAHGERGELTAWQRYRRHENRFIRTAHWSITGKCNYRCKHCYMSAPEAKLGELDHDTVMDIARQIVGCGIRQVNLTGGEPLVRRDFLDIVRYFVERDVRIEQIYTNGRLVTRELLEELAALGCRPEFNMSYDGDEGWHDWLRGIPQASSHVLGAFDLCREMGFPTSAEMCLHRGNLHVLRASVRTLAEHGCAALKTNPVAPTDLWRASGGSDYDLPMEELFEAYLAYVPAYFEDGMPLTLQLGGFFACRRGSTRWTIPSLHAASASGEPDEAACRAAAICGHARQTLYISPEGRMLPCMPLSSMPAQEAYPLVQEVGLAAGLTDSAYLSLITTTVDDYLAHNPECAACAFRYRCAGGCRSSALATTPDDVLGPDRAMCLMWRGGYAERVQEVARDAAERAARAS